MDMNWSSITFDMDDFPESASMQSIAPQNEENEDVRDILNASNSNQMGLSSNSSELDDENIEDLLRSKPAYHVLVKGSSSLAAGPEATHRLDHDQMTNFFVRHPTPTALTAPTAVTVLPEQLVKSEPSTSNQNPIEVPSLISKRGRGRGRTTTSLANPRPKIQKPKQYEQYELFKSDKKIKNAYNAKQNREKKKKEFQDLQTANTELQQTVHLKDIEMSTLNQQNATLNEQNANLNKVIEKLNQENVKLQTDLNQERQVSNSLCNEFRILKTTLQNGVQSIDSVLGHTGVDHAIERQLSSLDDDGMIQGHDVELQSSLSQFQNIFESYSLMQGKAEDNAH